MTSEQCFHCNKHVDCAQAGEVSNRIHSGIAGTEKGHDGGGALRRQIHIFMKKFKVRVHHVVCGPPAKPLGKNVPLQKHIGSRVIGALDCRLLHAPVANVQVLDGQHVMMGAIETCLES